GGIGFDVNCLHPESKILSKYGYFKKIKDFENKSKEFLVTFNLKSKKKETSEPILLLKRKEKEILKIKTKGGKEIKVGKDHPILTTSGMIEAKDLKENDYIAIFPFEEIEYEEPRNDIIINEADVKRICNSEKVVKELKDR